VWACRNNLPDLLLFALDYKRGKTEGLDEMDLYDPLRLISFWETNRELANFDFKTTQGNCILAGKLPATLKKKLDAYMHAAHKVVTGENGDTELEDSLTEEEDESDDNDTYDDDDATYTGEEDSESSEDGSDLEGFIVDSSEEEEDESEESDESEEEERLVKRSRRRLV
jgi:hypothetical protein